MQSRLKVLSSQPRIALGSLLTLLLSAAAVVGSGADFTASSANPSNTFAAGTLTIGNSKAGVAVLSASNLRPGEAAQTGEVDIENTGSLSGEFTLARGTTSNSDAANPLTAKLDLTVTDCGATCGDGDDAVVYTGTVQDMGTTALGTYAAGARHRYRFAVALAGTAGDAFQGDTATVSFDFNAA